MESVIVAAISLLGTAIGSFMGLIINNRLINYRIDRLDEHIKEHDRLETRVIALEKHNEFQDRDIKDMEDEQRRIIYDIKTLKGVKQNGY